MDSLFNPVLLPDVTAVRLKWAEIESEQTEFVNRSTDDALGKMLPFRSGKIRLIHLMQHRANPLMMRQLGAVPVSSDFHVFLLQRASEGPDSILETSVAAEFVELFWKKWRG